MVQAQTKAPAQAQRQAPAQAPLANELSTRIDQQDPSEPFITLEGVSKSFSSERGTVEALRPVDLSIKRGEFVSLIGPSGCGKSTLMMLLAGLLPATEGRISIDGKVIDRPSSDLGIVFQSDVLMQWRTAMENVMLQAEIRKLDRVQAKARATELLHMVGLEGFSDAYPHELSGGMRQRVSICRALLQNPPLLLMDEPFGALDALTRDQMQLDLLKLCSEYQMTVLFVTHSIIEAIFLSDRIVVLSPRPGSVEAIMDIELPRPRKLAMRESAEFSAYSQRVTDVFKSLGVLREEE